MSAEYKARIDEIDEFLAKARVQEAQADVDGQETPATGDLEAKGSGAEGEPVLPVEGDEPGPDPATVGKDDTGSSAEAETKDVSYEELSSRVRRAFHRQYRDAPHYSWVEKVYPEGYVIAVCAETERLYRHAYTQDADGVYVFEEGVLVEVTYEEKSSAPTYTTVVETAEGFSAFQKALGTLTDKVQEVWNKVVKQDEPEPSMPMLITKQQKDGRWRWVMISSTAFLDRDVPREIVSKEAVARSVSRADTDGAYGELLFWHEKGVLLGSCDFQAQHGLCLIESGLWSEDEMGEAARKAVDERPGYWGVSIGFLPGAVLEGVRIKGTQVKRVWTDIQIVERSILPVAKAASLFTSVQNAGGQKHMDEQKKAAMNELLGEDLAGQIISRADAINQKAKEPGAVFKEQDELSLNDRLVQFADSVESEDPSVSAIIKAVAETLTEDKALEDPEEPETPETKSEVEPGDTPTEPETKEAIEELLASINTKLDSFQTEIEGLKEQSAPRAALFQRPTSLAAAGSGGGDGQAKGLDDDEIPFAVATGASKMLKAVGLE